MICYALKQVYTDPSFYKMNPFFIKVKVKVKLSLCLTKYHIMKAYYALN